MRILVKTLTGETFDFDLPKSARISEVKAMINDKRLIFRGKEMEDIRTLSDYNVQDGAVLHLIFRSDVCGNRSSSALRAVRPSRPHSTSRHGSPGDLGGHDNDDDEEFRNEQIACLKGSLTKITMRYNEEETKKKSLTSNWDEINVGGYETEQDKIWKDVSEPEIELESATNVYERLKAMNYRVRAERERADRLSRELENCQAELERLYTTQVQERNYMVKLEQQIALFRNSWEQNVNNYREELMNLRLENGVLTTALRQSMESQHIETHRLQRSIDDLVSERAHTKVELASLRMKLEDRGETEREERKELEKKLERASRLIERANKRAQDSKTEARKALAEAADARSVARKLVEETSDHRHVDAPQRDVNEDFFKLTAFTVKFKLQQQGNTTPGRPISDLWRLAKIEGVPLHEYSEWLNQELSRDRRSCEGVPGEKHQIFVNLGEGRSVVPVIVNEETSTVGSVKAAIEAQRGIPASDQILVNRNWGGSLMDCQRLADVNVQRHSTLYLDTSSK